MLEKTAFPPLYESETKVLILYPHPERSHPHYRPVRRSGGSYVVVHVRYVELARQTAQERAYFSDGRGLGAYGTVVQVAGIFASYDAYDAFVEPFDSVIAPGVVRRRSVLGISYRRKPVSGSEREYGRRGGGGRGNHWDYGKSREASTMHCRDYCIRPCTAVRARYRCYCQALPPESTAFCPLTNPSWKLPERVLFPFSPVVRPRLKNIVRGEVSFRLQYAGVFDF